MFLNYSLPYENEELKEDSCLVEEAEETEKEHITTNVQSLQNNGEIHSKSRTPPPRYSVCNDAPTFAVTVTDADLDVCPIDIEGMEFGPSPVGNNRRQRNDQTQRTVSVSTCDSVVSQASEVLKNYCFKKRHKIVYIFGHLRFWNC